MISERGSGSDNRSIIKVVFPVLINFYMNTKETPLL